MLGILFPYRGDVFVNHLNINFLEHIVRRLRNGTKIELYSIYRLKLFQKYSEHIGKIYIVYIAHIVSNSFKNTLNILEGFLIAKVFVGC